MNDIWICPECREEYEKHELRVIVEPHGERTLHCPGGCDEAPMPLDEWDPTPYIAEVK